MIKEIELSSPIEKYLEDLGYKVRSEVKNCDITAVKGEEFIVVECKTSLSLKLIYQCVDRQEFCDNVYMALPVINNKKIPNRNSLIKLLKRLRLGLILVHFLKSKTKVEVVLDPKDFKKITKVKKRDRILNEINLRSGNYNRGGDTRVKLMTAYKESALEIAQIILNNGSMSSKDLKKMGTAPKTYDILYKNYYGWFFKDEGRGKYGITEKGKSALTIHRSILS